MNVGNLYNYKTSKFIRKATQHETNESIKASKIDGGAGVIDINGFSCYVQGGEQIKI